jgi:hypothetical protein
MMDNKDTDILKPCESDFKCGNYMKINILEMS